MNFMIMLIEYTKHENKFNFFKILTVQQIVMFKVRI